jgi:hypothetical protein
MANGTDYSHEVEVDENGSIRLAIMSEDGQSLSTFLGSFKIAHTSVETGDGMTKLSFGSDVSPGVLRTVLKRWAEVTG